jgi:hypothetical protein
MDMKRIVLALVAFALCCFASVAPASEATITLATASGTVSKGMQEVTLIFSSDFEGTVQGVAFDGSTDASLTLRAQAGQTLGQVRYTITAGSIRIVRVL